MRSPLTAGRSLNLDISTSLSKVARMKGDLKGGGHVIVFGNEKGGSGKSTTAMHVFVALARERFRVGAMDLDVRQKSFFRYTENRSAFARSRGINLILPDTREVLYSKHSNRERAQCEELNHFLSALGQLMAVCDVVIIDCPGADTYLSRLAHAAADTLITPMNDSFIDFDLLARVDPVSLDIVGPSVYSEMVWESRKHRALSGLMPLDWVVMQNRVSPPDVESKRRVSNMLQKLAKRLGFRVASGFCERTIFRELFLNGLTLLDIRNPASGVEVNMSHIAARQEVRDLMSSLNIPEKISKAARTSSSVGREVELKNNNRIRLARRS
mgnify:CR=1 FL=1